MAAKQQTLGGAESEEPDGVGAIPRARPMKTPPGTGRPAPPVAEPSSMPGPVAPRGIGWCPEIKHQSPEWADIERAKLERKEKEVSAEPAQMPAVPPAPAEYAAKQQEFLKAAEARRAEFAAMSSDDREREYDRFKTSFLGE